MTEQVIHDLQAQPRAAQLGFDVAALKQLIADDLLFVGPDGWRIVGGQVSLIPGHAT